MAVTGVFDIVTALQKHTIDERLEELCRCIYKLPSLLFSLLVAKDASHECSHSLCSHMVSLCLRYLRFQIVLHNRTRQHAGVHEATV